MTTTNEIDEDTKRTHLRRSQKTIGTFENEHHAVVKADRTPRITEKRKSVVENKTVKKNSSGRHDTDKTVYHPLVMKKNISEGPASTNTTATLNLRAINHPQAIARDHPDDQENLVTKNLDTENQGIEGRKQIQKMTAQHPSTRPMPLWINQIGINSKITTTPIQELKGVERKDPDGHTNDHTTRGGVMTSWTITKIDINTQKVTGDTIATIRGTSKTNSTGMIDKTNTDTNQAIRHIDREIT